MDRRAVAVRRFMARKARTPAKTTGWNSRLARMPTPMK